MSVDMPTQEQLQYAKLAVLTDLCLMRATQPETESLVWEIAGDEKSTLEAKTFLLGSIAFKDGDHLF